MKYSLGLVGGAAIFACHYACKTDYFKTLNFFKTLDFFFFLLSGHHLFTPSASLLKVGTIFFSFQGVQSLHFLSIFFKPAGSTCTLSHSCYSEHQYLLEKVLCTFTSPVFMSGAPMFVAAIQGTTLDHLALGTRVVCVPGAYGTVIKFWADYHLQGTT